MYSVFVVSLKRRACLPALLLFGVLFTAEAEEPDDSAEPVEARHRQELHLEKSGETTYHLVFDYGPTRWFLAQEYRLFPEEKAVSPFTELRPPRQPADRLRDILAPQRSTIGFASPWLWFGPVTLEGGLAALERPLEQTPFSGSWAAQSGTSLSVGRDPPSRLGVGGALGPLSVHHFRTEELRRTAGVLSFGAPEEPRLWGEVLLTHEQTVRAPPLIEEPWFLDEPPRLEEEGYHGALRGGFNGGLIEQSVLLGASGSPLDPPGFAAVSVTRLAERPWGISFAWLDSAYRNGELELPSPGFSAVLMRKPGVRRGHTLGVELSGIRTGAAGAGEEGEFGGKAALRWKWRPSRLERWEPRWALDLRAEREGRLPEGDRLLWLRVAGTPELRLEGSGGKGAVRIIVPTEIRRECESRASTVRTVEYGVDLTVRLAPFSLNPSWTVEQVVEKEPMHSPALSLLLSCGERNRVQIGFRTRVADAMNWEELVALSIYDEGVEGELFIRLSG